MLGFGEILLKLMQRQPVGRDRARSQRRRIEQQRLDAVEEALG